MSQVNYMKSKSLQMNTKRIQPPSSHRLPIPGPPGFPNVFHPPNIPQENNIRSQSPTVHTRGLFIPVVLNPISNQNDMVNSGIANGAGGKKIVRTNDEDTKLVDRMMEVHALRISGVSDELRCRYEKAAQALFEENVGKIMKLKTSVDFVHDMLAGKHMTGFSWDPEKLCVTTDNHVWDEYIKSHPYAARFRNMPFPHYDKLCIFFDKERVTGFQAGGLGDKGVKRKNRKSPCLEATDLHIGRDVPPSLKVREGASSKRKRAKGKDLIVTCVESLLEPNDHIKSSGLTSINNMETAPIERINTSSDIIIKVTTQVKGLHGLTLDERLLAISVIGRSATLAQMFDLLDRNEKIRMAQLVANGLIR